MGSMCEILFQIFENKGNKRLNKILFQDLTQLAPAEHTFLISRILGFSVDVGQIFIVN